jgi:hypothetical protein
MSRYGLPDWYLNPNYKVPAERIKGQIPWDKWARDLSKDGRMNHVQCLIHKVNVYNSRGLVVVPLQGKRAFTLDYTNKSKEEHAIDFEKVFKDYIAGRVKWTDEEILNESLPYDENAPAKVITGPQYLNIGCVAGPSNKLILDVDSKKGKPGLETFKNLLESANIKSLATLYVNSGSNDSAGHYWLEMPQDIDPDSLSSGYGGLDIMRGGRQVVTPYSIHPSGRSYLPIDSNGKQIPLNADNFGIKGIARAPDSLINVLLKDNTQKSKREQKEKNYERLNREEPCSITPDALTDLLGSIHPEWRSNHSPDDKLKLAWAIRYLLPTDEGYKIGCDFWKNQARAGGEKGKVWDRFNDVFHGKDYDRGISPTKGYIFNCVKWSPHTRGPNTTITIEDEPRDEPSDEPSDEDEPVTTQQKKLEEWEVKYSNNDIKQWDISYNQQYCRSLDFPRGSSGDKNTILLMAPPGSGKTTQLIAYAKKLYQECTNQLIPFILRIITPRISHGFNMASAFRVEFPDLCIYKTELGDLDRFDELIITPDSLHRLQPRSPTLTIMDECETIITQFLSSTMKKTRHWVVGVYEELMKRSKYVILADAFPSQMSLDNAQALRGADKVLTIRNMKNPIQRTAFKCPTKETLYATLIEKVKAGERHFVNSMSESDAEHLYEILIKEFPEKEIGIITGERAKRKGIDKLIEEYSNINEEWVKFDVLIVTNTITIGMDMTVQHFHGNFVILTPVGSGLIRDLAQAMCRPRNYINNTLYYWIDKRRTTPQYGLTIPAIKMALKEDADKVNEQHKKFGALVGFDDRKLSDSDGIPEWLQNIRIYAYWERTMTGSRPKLVYKQYLRRMNYVEGEKVDEETINCDEKKPKIVKPIDSIELGSYYPESMYNTIVETPYRVAKSEYNAGKINEEQYKYMLLKIYELERTYLRNKARRGDLKEDEYLALEKYYFFDRVNEEHQNQKIWTLWTGPRSDTIRSHYYIAKEIEEIIKTQPDASPLTIEERYNAYAFKTEYYYTLNSRAINTRKWAIELLKILRTKDSQNISLTSLKTGVDISIDSFNQLATFIEDKKDLIKKELGKEAKKKKIDLKGAKDLEDNEEEPVIDGVNVLDVAEMNDEAGEKLRLTNMIFRTCLGVVIKRKQTSKRVTVYDKTSKKKLQKRVFTTVGYTIPRLSQFEWLPNKE